MTDDEASRPTPPAYGPSELIARYKLTLIAYEALQTLLETAQEQKIHFLASNANKGPSPIQLQETIDDIFDPGSLKAIARELLKNLHDVGAFIKNLKPNVTKTINELRELGASLVVVGARYPHFDFKPILVFANEPSLDKLLDARVCADVLKALIEGAGASPHSHESDGTNSTPAKSSESASVAQRARDCAKRIDQICDRIIEAFAGNRVVQDRIAFISPIVDELEFDMLPVVSWAERRTNADASVSLKRRIEIVAGEACACVRYEIPEYVTGKPKAVSEVLSPGAQRTLDLRAACIFIATFIRDLAQDIEAESESPGGRSIGVNQAGDADSSPTESQASVRGGKYMSPRELAEHFDKNLNSVKTRLREFKKKNHSGYREVADGSSREPKYIFDIDIVGPVIEGIKSRNSNRK